MKRTTLIEQLRHALSLATSPNVDVVEFDLGDTDFSFDFSSKDDCSCAELGSECPTCEVDV